MRIKIIFSLLLIALMYTPKISAECTTDCNGEWIDPYAQSPQELAYIVETVQTWKINYKYRECSDGNGGTYKEFKLESLELLSGTATGTTETLMRKALERLLWMSPSLFTNCTGSNGWNVTVVTDCCWKTNTSSGDKREICSTSTCCKYTYNVRPTSDGGLEVNSTTASGGNCTLPNSCAAYSGCNNVCSYGQIPSNTRITPDDNSCNPCNLPFVPDSKNKVEFKENLKDVKAYYSYLTCNDTLYVTVSEITSDTNLTKDIVKKALGKSIRAALLANTGTTTIKLVIPSCWIKFTDKKATKPCSYTDCCTYYYKVQIFGSSISVITSRFESSAVSCNDQCVLLCDEFYEYEAQDYLPKAKSNSLDTEININDKLLVKPNPSTGLSTIEIESESMGRLTLKLLDLQGREVQKIDRFKSGKSLSLQLDGTNLAQGTYTLQLIIENQVIATTNLIIQK